MGRRRRPYTRRKGSSQLGTGETDGYRLVWQDLFDDGVLNETDHWSVEVNGDGGGNNELQYYRRENIEACCIGNVAVGKAYRSMGYMIELMEMSVEDMRKNGVDVAYLGGQRQRYGLAVGDAGADGDGVAVGEGAGGAFGGGVGRGLAVAARCLRH